MSSDCASNKHCVSHFDEIVPVVYTPVLFVFRTLAITLGLPVQFLVVNVILRNRQLHTPRNAFWLGNIACHFAILLMGIYEYWAVIVRTTNPTFCRIFCIMSGEPYATLLVSLLLATADRWFAINDPIKHRKYVTVSRVAGCLIISWILVVIILTSPYWSGRVPFSDPCEGFTFITRVILKWVTLSHFVMAVAIIVAQISVYVKTRHYICDFELGDTKWRQIQIRRRIFQLSILIRMNISSIYPIKPFADRNWKRYRHFILRSGFPLCLRIAFGFGVSDVDCL